jgi:hypothetical protein
LFAGVSANAAMFHSHGCVFLAFFGAGSTNICADLADAVDELSIHHHDFGGRSADGCAFKIQPDTVSQAIDFLFVKTGAGAFLANGGAIDTCVDTGLKFCVRHGHMF